jgi:hypothetical protein
MSPADSQPTSISMKVIRDQHRYQGNDKSRQLSLHPSCSFPTKVPFIDTIGSRVAEWNRPRQKENVLLQSRELVAASFIHSGATKKSQSLQKLDYRDIAACAARRRKVR